MRLSLKSLYSLFKAPPKKEDYIMQRVAYEAALRANSPKPSLFFGQI
jgi:hypothetical protein